MKAKYIFFIFIISIIEVYSQQTGWTWINRQPQGNTLNASVIVSSGTAFITGEYGALLKTTNYGNNWTPMFTLPFSNYSCMFFINSSTGFAGGGYINPNIYRTTDAGNSWQLLVTGLTQYENVNTIFFYNQYTGIASASYGKMLYTTNSGDNWVTFTSGVSGIDDFTAFSNSDACYARTYNSILKSYSMGSNWLTLQIPDSTYNIYDMVFLNQDTGMYTATFRNGGQTAKLVKTTNGGYLWYSYNTIANYSWNDMFFINDNTGYMTGNSYYTKDAIAKTTNGGVNWVIQEDSIKNTLNDIRFYNSNTGFASGMYGLLLTTTNGGTNWNYYSSGFTDNVTDMYFASEQTGYISTSYNKQIFRTTNGCISWDTVFTAPENISSINFLNSSTGYLAGGSNYYSGFIYKTTNGCLSWTPQIYFQYQPIRKIRFLNDQDGYALMDGGKILKTTNGGNNWDSITAGGSNDLSFINTATGFVSGYGRVCKTTNGGLNWAYYTISSNANLYAICFINSTTGFVSGYYNYNGSLYKTTDQGATWNLVITNFFTGTMGRIMFINSSTGFIISSNTNRMFKTTDAGITWGYQDMFAGGLGNMYFLTSSTGFIGGSNGNLLKTTNGGGNFVGINKQYTSTIPENFSLSQNYPNPFNPVTTIKFALPQARNGRDRSLQVRVIIYDVLGREITTLVNQQLQPGEYSVTWDASKYPSGVYLYVLSTGEPSLRSGQSFTDSKKMVLIK
jgi:photosystem II stability/assembly factor-like uncharacterized protein